MKRQLVDEEEQVRVKEEQAEQAGPIKMPRGVASARRDPTRQLHPSSHDWQSGPRNA